MRLFHKTCEKVGKYQRCFDCLYIFEEEENTLSLASFTEV